MESQSNFQLSTLDDKEDDDVVEADPSGRFERYRKSLGRGAYKEVFLAYDQEEGVEVAWNQIRIDSFVKADVTRMHNEIKILETLRNENIINMLYSWRAPSKYTGKEEIYFITELMTSGTLKGYIRKTKGPIKPKIIRNWCKQILKGLLYLHSRQSPIIHRDLKCDNIFINGNNGQAKIGDLGLAAIKASHHLSSVLGTPEFMAPELYDERYDEKVDIYAFGMVILEIATKEYPYRECTNQAQIYKKVSSGIKPAALQKVLDPEIRSFIELCIEHDPRKRPTAEELLSHPFFNQIPSNGSATDLAAMDLPSFDSPSGSMAEVDSNSVQKVVDSENHHFFISKQSTPMKQNATCEVEAISPVIEEEVTLKMTYHTGTNTSEIRFPFNLSSDTATDVVSEMVRENLIDAIDEQLTRRRIEEAIRTVLIGNRWTSLSSSINSDALRSDTSNADDIKTDVSPLLKPDDDSSLSSKLEIDDPRNIPVDSMSNVQSPTISNWTTTSIQPTLSVNHSPTNLATVPTVPLLDLASPLISPVLKASHTSTELSPVHKPSDTVNRNEHESVKRNLELEEKPTQLQELNLKSFDDSGKAKKQEMTGNRVVEAPSVSKPVFQPLSKQ